MNGGKGGVLRDGPLRQDGVRVRRCTPSSSTAPARSVSTYLLLLLRLTQLSMRMEHLLSVSKQDESSLFNIYSRRPYSPRGTQCGVS